MALAGHTGEWLSLDGVTTLSTAAADALAGYNGVLGLNSLATLTSAALATRLVSDITTDQVDSQKRILPYEQEEIPPWAHFGEVALPAVTELSPEAAHAIVAAIRAVAGEYPDLMIDAERGNDGLELNGLRSLSVEVARELARHGGYLSLRGVTALSAAAAEALAGIGEHTLVCPSPSSPSSSRSETPSLCMAVCGTIRPYAQLRSASSRPSQTRWSIVPDEMRTGIGAT